MTWLLWDVQNSAHRLFHALPPMKGPCGRSEVVFGFLREIKKLQRKFKTEKVAFFFDYGRPIRCDVLPEYKLNRAESKAKRAGTDKDDKHLQKQIDALRECVLPGIGFNNVFFDEGFEADDLIVSFYYYDLQHKGHEAIIISSDKDYWQALQTGLNQYNPTTNILHDGESSMTGYGLNRSQFAKMKAIAGCSSDNISGVQGVGDKTAAKFLLGTLNKDFARYKDIKEAKKLIERNLSLVLLPHPDTPLHEAEPDSVTDKKWQRMADRWGIKNIEV